MSSTNFLQFDQNGLNMLLDAAYEARTELANGVQVGEALPGVYNKLFYQLSTFVAAFANMLVAKGLSPSDANLAALETLLANVITNYDLLHSPVIPKIFQDAGRTKEMSLPNSASDILVALAAAQALSHKDLTDPTNSFPTLNQDTTGKAAALAAQYIDWAAASGGASIKNKPMIQRGIGTTLSCPNNTVGSVIITFPNPFNTVPHVNITPISPYPDGFGRHSVDYVNGTSFAAYIYNESGAATILNFEWIAIGT